MKHNLVERNNLERQLTNTAYWHSQGYTGKGIHIVFFDTKGILFDHMTYADTPLYDDATEISHGTHTVSAGHEFAPGARMTLLTPNPASRGWFEANADDIDIVNISRSAPRGHAENSYGFLKEYPDIPVFVSSGNDGRDRVSYPSAFDWTISVGAFESNRNAPADYSNWGEKLDILGFTNIFIRNSRGEPWRSGLAGTSFSSPQGAGSVACYMQYLKESGISYDREDIRKMIHVYADDIFDDGFDEKSGYGVFRLPDYIPEVEKEKEDISKPEDEITKPKPEKSKEVLPVSKFSDVDNHWANEAIREEEQHGTVSGYNDGTFRPNDSVTRAEMVVMLNRLRKQLTSQ